MKNINKKTRWIISVVIVLILIVALFYYNEKNTTKADVYNINTNSTIGYVELIVSDIDTVLDFYQEVIGFSVLSETADEVTLSADDETKLLVLKEDKSAIERPAGTTGLFHLAILVPTRQDLAVTLKHLLETGYPIQGASDHLYSEAIYLADPEGNGIEIYVDREPDLWETDKQGNYITDTLPVDINGLFTALGNKEWDGLPEKTRLGHMHLQMSNLEEAKEFYVDALGFDVVTEGNGMLFVSKNRYHHHIGMNTWAGTGLPQPPDNARGMNYFTINFSDDEYQTAKIKLAEMNYTFEEQDGVLWLADPSGNSIKITRDF